MYALMYVLILKICIASIVKIQRTDYDFMSYFSLNKIFISFLSRQTGRDVAIFAIRLRL